MILWIYPFVLEGDPSTRVLYRCHIAERPLGRPDATDRYTVQVFRDQGTESLLIKEASFPAPNKLEAAVAFRRAIDQAYRWHEAISGAKPGDPPPPAPGSYSLN